MRDSKNKGNGAGKVSGGGSEGDAGQKAKRGCLILELPKLE